MAASRMSRISSRRLALAWLTAAIMVAAVSTDSSSAAENLDDVELITASRAADEYVAISAAEGDTIVGASPSDLKKNSLNKKFQKFYPKTEADWNFKGEGKKTDVFIKDAKDYRLLRIISEGLLRPQDVLPLGSDDATISSQKNNGSNEEMNVNVQPEGMSGIVNDGIAVDSDEKIIMEKKKNGTVNAASIKPENDGSAETEKNVKINLDASAGVQSPKFHKQRGTIAVPEQKQISLSKVKETKNEKKAYESSGYDVIPLNKQREKHHTDEGVFDFVDSPLSDKHLVPAGTAQTSRVNVKKGPNGQEYEYEYIYYYYEDGDEPDANKNANKNAAGKNPKGNEIPISTAGPTQRTTTPFTRISSTPSPQFTQTFSENSSNRIKSTEIVTGPASPSIQSSQPSQQQQPNRDKFRNDFRYNTDNSVPLTQQIPQGPTKNAATANEVYWQYDSSRFPGRQAQPQTFSEPPFVPPQETIATTKQGSRGRIHFNNPQVTTEEASFLNTASPFLTQPPKETPTRSKSVTGALRQPGLELVDSNSFRTHSTNVPADYENSFSPAQTFDTQRGKAVKQNSPQQEFSTIAQTFPSSTFPPKTEIFKKEPTIEFTTGTDRFAPQQTTSPRIITQSSTEILNRNTAPISTAPDNSLTTVYGPGLTDKAAHDLYAIYQQTQNEETVRNTIAHDDRTTIIDEPVDTFVQTNPPATSVFTIVPQTTITTTTTTTAAPTTTTTTTTTPPPPPPPPTTTTTANVVQSSPLPGRSRFRGTGINRNKLSLGTTEAPQSADSAGESSEKSRPKFQPSHRREPGHRVSAYGRRGSTSTTTTSPEGDSSTASSNVETSSKSHSFVPSSRTRFRSSTPRTENGNGDSQSTSSPGPRPNFADRYNSRRRHGLRTSTTAAPEPEQEEGSVRQDTNNSNVETSSPSDQQSTTFRSIRNRFNNNRPQALRPGAKLNFSSRGRFGTPSSSTPAPVPLDADPSGSADIPVEQKKEDSEHTVSQDAISDTTVSSISSTTVNTPHPDPLSRLKNRSKLRISDKGGHARINAQQANSTAILNQNRRNLVHNLLPRKKQLSTSTEGSEVPVKDEKADNAAKPVTEESEDDVPPPKTDTEVSESQSPAEAPSTTESRLSSLIASRRNSLAGRRPGTFSRSNKPPTTEES